ncbi:oxidoreductase [Halobacteriales archaeon QS_9_67_17]|nr:MAG: oxidoreductase [Halobacteriales archaeon QS_9_67_17]
MELGLDGDAALVTAGSGGLGLASATALAEEGAHVAVCGTTPEHVDEARATLEATGDGGVLAVEADITEKDAIEEFVAETVDAFGGLDHVVTSAGGPPSGSFLDTDDEDWQRAHDLLVMSVVRTTRAAYPHNAVRRGVLGLMKTQSHEWAPDVRVNAVLPGAHETSRIEDLVEQGVERGEYDSYEQGIDDWSEGIPTERVGDPAELGETVAWLCSDAASYVTGTAIPVDGGSTRSV